jgi:hypothetical protein
MGNLADPAEARHAVCALSVGFAGAEPQFQFYQSSCPSFSVQADRVNMAHCGEKVILEHGGTDEF